MITSERGVGITRDCSFLKYWKMFLIMNIHFWSKKNFVMYAQSRMRR